MSEQIPDIQRRLLVLLGTRAATVEHLAARVGMPADELRPELEAMERRGWISGGVSMWIGDTSSAINVFKLTDAGRQELKRQDPGAATDEPLTLTREELLNELKRALGVSRQTLEMNPNFDAERFHYWPLSGHAWMALRDDDT